MADQTPYSARWKGPTLIARGVAFTVTVAVEHNGTAPTVSAVSFTLIDSGGNVLVDAATASESGGTLSYTVLAAATTGKTLGIGYLVRFDVTISGDVHTFYNDAALCRTPIYPPVGCTDLTNRYSRLSALQTTGASDLQKFIVDAWFAMTTRMYAEGLPFWRMRTPSALREYLTTQALVYALADLALTLGGGSPYRDEALRLEATLPRIYNRIRSLMDSAEDDQVSHDQQPAGSVIVLSSGRLSRWRS